MLAEHSINHINNFHKRDDDINQDEIILKNSRTKKKKKSPKYRAKKVFCLLIIIDPNHLKFSLFC